VAAATPKAPHRVPKFDTGPDRPTMNRLQKSFYHRTFLPSLLAGDPVDVQAQWGYALVLLCDLIEERQTNPTEARLTLGIPSGCLPWLVTVPPARDLAPFLWGRL
jgi:hypothetical protein